MNREDCLLAMRSDLQVYTSTFFAALLPSGKVYFDCSEGCCRDEFENFDAFWDCWGSTVEEEGYAR